MDCVHVHIRFFLIENNFQQHVLITFEEVLYYSVHYFPVSRGPVLLDPNGRNVFNSSPSVHLHNVESL